MGAGLLADLPSRPGPAPRTSVSMPHRQLDQTAPTDLQEQVLSRSVGLPGVVAGPSLVSVPGARALALRPDAPAGPPEAFMAGREFAHVHPPDDGSLHLTLPEDVAAEVVRKGWGELHPAARMGLIPATAVMVYGPRDVAELETVWRIIRTSHAFAAGQTET